MSGFPNISQEQMQQLLTLASKKLGKPTSELKSQLESQNIEKLASSLNDKQKNQLNELLKDPKKVESLLSNPAVKSMISKYMK